RHLRHQPFPQLRRQRGEQTAGKVVEHPRRGQHREHPLGRRGRHAVLLRRGDHRAPGPAPVQQGEHGRRLPQPGHRHRPPRVHPELQRVPVPPHRQQSRLQSWPHAHMLTPPPDIQSSARAARVDSTSPVPTPASASTGTTRAACATPNPLRHAPAASAIRAPTRRRAPGAFPPGRATEVTSQVSVPVRNVVEKLLNPISLTAADCMPMAAAATASSANSAPRRGLASVISHPAAPPASSASSTPSAQLTCRGSTLDAPAGERFFTPWDTQVATATPVMYPATATAVWLASDTDRSATARPKNTMLPVMTLVNTPPSRVKAATSFAPEAKVS